jgi:tRNA(Arg) A34 adenosine deaminase TadA
MCCWAILEAGIKGLVLGARHAEMKRTDYGDYAVEKLLSMTRRKLEIVTGVMVADCEAIRRSWKGWKEL